VEYTPERLAPGLYSGDMDATAEVGDAAGRERVAGLRRAGRLVIVRSGRVHTRLLIGLAGAGTGLLILVCGWPHWHRHPVGTAATFVVGSTFAAAAALLATGERSRRAGVLFLAASVLWGLAWLGSWNVGYLPALGEMCQSGFFFCTGVGTLYYPGGDLRHWRDRAWIVQAAVTLFVSDSALILMTRPEWNGYAADVWWPAVNDDPATAEVIRTAISVSYFALAFSLVAVLIAKARLLSRADRAVIVPVLAAVGIVGVVSAAAELRVYQFGVRLEDQLQVLTLENLLAAGIPLTLFAAELRRRWAELGVGARLLELADPVSAQSVRHALRVILGDRVLDIALWLPDAGRYVTCDGRLVGDGGPQGSATGRWRYQVTGPAGERIAIVDLAEHLQGRAPGVDAAMVAARRALEIAQVQAALLEHVRAAQQRLVRAQAAERARLERDLHDGAQQRFLALGVRLGMLEAIADDEELRRHARRCRLELLEAVDDLRSLAQGIHPALLTQRGIGPALEAVVARIGRPVRLDVPAQRFPPDVESTAYFALCEALTNAVKHSGAGQVIVDVRAEAGSLVGRVVDDGVGGAAARAGGGLLGIEDRVGAMRGTVMVDSPPGGGTTVRLDIPYA
jgi:signal transduction histidine kinase